jgi:serine/threonine-protein kinase RsbW
MSSDARLTDRLTVPGGLDSLQSIGEFVHRASQAAGLDKMPAYRLRLAVDEIATNIVTHGYLEAGRSGDLTLESRLSDTALILVLEDRALPFDPRTHKMAEEDLSKPLEQRRIGGLGIFLALKGVDEFDYQSTGDHNRSIFVMHLAPGKGTTPPRQSNRGEG